MSWRIPFVTGTDQVQTPLRTQGIQTQSWYPDSVILPSSQTSAYGTSSRSEPALLTADAESEGIISRLKDKSVDGLKKLLSDKDAYNALLNSLDEVKNQNHTYEGLQKETLQLAEANAEKEASIIELKNQSTIIRTSELASAQEKLAELLRQRDEIINSYSLRNLIDKLKEAAYKADQESDILQTKILKEEVDIHTFIQDYKNLRIAHHRRTLLHLAAKTSVR
ncbi:Vacuolar protein-sorting-associated protein 37 [Carex littledalei]|uniref:Vacuolar protein-sorting-associated protein 37 n=1 Tax=Carex littledalei TaxID=544730 RepID=A0A833VEJ2_9POAL|nr:Vacuolar protein-sorting-associated protein 37 [Carex littledalei]